MRDVRRVAVLGELEVVPPVAQCRERPSAGAVKKPFAPHRTSRCAGDQLRVRASLGVDGDDGQVGPQRRDVVGLAVRRPLAGVAEAARDVDERLLHRVLAVRGDVVDGEPGAAELASLGRCRGEQLPRRVDLQRLPRDRASRCRSARWSASGAPDRETSITTVPRCASAGFSR